jgi:hypothetical protein
MDDRGRHHHAPRPHLRSGRVHPVARASHQAHGSGHEGVQKTLDRLRASFYSHHAPRMVRHFAKSCTICQRSKTEHLHPACLLQPLNVPRMVWADIAMDFVEGFPRISGKSVVLTIVDRFSKYAHFIALGHPYTAISVAQAFFDNIVRLHGLPCSIVSDQEPVFTSAFWTELFTLTGVKLRLSSAFHRVLGVYLRCLVGDQPKQWLRWLPWVEYCYNSSYQTALQTMPFEVVYGRAPPTLASYRLGLARVVALDRQLQERDVFLADIRNHLLQAQDYMKVAADRSRRKVEFAVGDWAWLRLHHRSAAGITDSTNNNLAPSSSVRSK